MISRRVALSIVAVFVCVAIFATFASRRAVESMKRDLRADISWTEVEGPLEQRTRAYRWYPLSYPILERWTFGDDYVRSQYALATIVHFGGRFGGPLSRHWLATAIDRDPNMTALSFPMESDPGSKSFLRALGLSDPASRRAAAYRAVEHIGKPRGEVQTFDEFFIPWLGNDALPAVEDAAAHADDAKLSAFDGVVPIDYSLMPDARPAEATRLQARTEAAWRRTHPDVPEPVATFSPPDLAVSNAIIALNSGDTHGLPLLRTIVDGDLRRLDVTSYEPELLAVANAFPNSRFTRGCLAYDALRGGSYFARDDDHDWRMPPGSIAGWRDWLATYPDHPGADDAMYWLGRAYQDSGRRVDATWTFADALERHVGDGDMRDALWRRLLFMLDVGTSEDDLATVMALHPHSAYAPLVRYARAVRRARANDFSGALTLSADSQIEVAFRKIQPYLSEDTVVAYRSQRERWKTLATISPDLSTATLAARDRLASAWSDEDGWKIGYLNIFFDRHGGAMLYGDPRYQWADLAGNAQRANQNAQTIALAKPLTASSIPADIRKRNQRRIITALYQQITEFPDDETYMMGELPSLPASVGRDASLYPAVVAERTAASEYGLGYVEQQRENDVDAWWARQTIVEAERYAADYPNDEFASTALLSAYEVTGRVNYLREIIARYPEGSRTDEARALLWRATTPRN